MPTATRDLYKSEVYPGSVLWLDRDADIEDSVAYHRSGLDPGALDHPVLVVDTLRDDHDYAWICVMTGTYHSHAGDIPAEFSISNSPGPQKPTCKACHCPHDSNHKEGSKMLYHKDHTAKMCKATRVRPTSIWGVSLKMLRLERSQTGVSGLELDDDSLFYVSQLSGEARTDLIKISYAVRKWPITRSVNFNHNDPLPPNSGLSVAAVTLPRKSTQVAASEKKARQKSSLKPTAPLAVKSSTATDKANDSEPLHTLDTSRSMTLANPIHLLQPNTLAGRSTIAVVTRAVNKPASPTTKVTDPPHHVLDAAAVASPGNKQSTTAQTSSSTGSHGAQITPQAVDLKAGTSLLVTSTAKASALSPLKNSAPATTTTPISEATDLALSKTRSSVSSSTKVDSPSTLKIDKTKKSTCISVGSKTDVLDSKLSHVNEEKKAGPSLSESKGSTITVSHSSSDQHDLSRPPKPLAAKLDSIAVTTVAALVPGAIATDSAGMASATSSANPQSKKLKTQAKRPAATAAIVPQAAVPTHPYTAGDIVWCDPRSYEGENEDPLEHVEDITNRPTCVVGALVPGRPDCVYIRGITTFAKYKLRHVPLPNQRLVNYLAIATSKNPRPDCGHIVKMHDAKPMPRERIVSYINANKAYAVSGKILKKMDESRKLGDHRLDDQSVKKLREVRAHVVAGRSML